MAELSGKYKLTGGESLQVITQCLADYLAGVAKYMIREERHGNTDTPGGWE